MSTATSPLLEIPVDRIDGTATTLAEHAGKVVLVVNVASKCGLTPQYDALEAVYTKYREQGFVICGFPANDFAGQEPGTNDEIATFCTTSFNVDFPLYAKIAVTGEQKHPLYAALITGKPGFDASTEGMRAGLTKYGITPNPEPEVLWNFEKFLLSKDGAIVARFPPDMKPNDAVMTAAIEQELSR